MRRSRSCWSLRSADKEVGESCCQEAAGASKEDVEGCPPAWFGGAVYYCSGAGEDACDD
jgi:hypothetical protein